METFYPGAKAYMDALGAPLVPCVVLSVTGAPTGRAATQSAGAVVVRLTANRGPYRRGEVHTLSGMDAPPRKCVFVRGGQFRVATNYRYLPAKS